ALATLVDNAFGGSADGSSFAIAAGSITWLLLSSAYFVAFWTLAGQTPGMRFLGVRLAGGPLALGRALRRIFGIGISLFLLGLPFLGVLLGQSRRGFADRIAGTDVVYDEEDPRQAPWSAVAEGAAQ